MFATLTAILMILFLFPLLSLNLSASENNYVGAGKCMSCHQKEYDSWKASGHAMILRKSSAIDQTDIPFPAGYDKKDISYFIGGYRWKTLFLDKNGYLITSPLTRKGNDQYALKSKKWGDNILRP